MHSSDLHGLSPVQAQAALSLASGASYSQAAQSAGVARSTLYSWIDNHPSFAAAVESARQDYIETLREQLREASQKALKTLVSILDDESASPGVRLKAALAVLKRPHYPDPGWHLPEPLESPQQQATLQILADIKADTKIINYESKTRHNRTNSDAFEQEIPTPQSPPPPKPPQTAQPPQPPPQNARQPYTNPNKTGRNETCPCGSGLKFKRCCLNKRSSAAA